MGMDDADGAFVMPPDRLIFAIYCAAGLTDTAPGDCISMEIDEHGDHVFVVTVVRDGEPVVYKTPAPEWFLNDWPWLA